MDDLNVIDQFMDTFVRYIDSGFGLLGPDVGFLTTVLFVPIYSQASQRFYRVIPNGN